MRCNGAGFQRRTPGVPGRKSAWMHNGGSDFPPPARESRAASVSVKEPVWIRRVKTGGAGRAWGRISGETPGPRAGTSSEAPSDAVPPAPLSPEAPRSPPAAPGPSPSPCVIFLPPPLSTTSTTRPSQLLPGSPGESDGSGISLPCARPETGPPPTACAAPARPWPRSLPRGSRQRCCPCHARVSVRRAEADARGLLPMPRRGH